MALLQHEGGLVCLNSAIKVTRRYVSHTGPIYKYSQLAQGYMCCMYLKYILHLSIVHNIFNFDLLSLFITVSSAIIMHILCDYSYWSAMQILKIKRCIDLAKFFTKYFAIVTIANWLKPQHTHLCCCSMSLQWRHNDRDGVSNHQPHDCLLKRLFRRRSKKIWKLRVTGLCAGNSPVTGEFHAKRASNAENVSIWLRYRVYKHPCRHATQINLVNISGPAYYGYYCRRHCQMHFKIKFNWSLFRCVQQ